MTRLLLLAVVAFAASCTAADAGLPYGTALYLVSALVSSVVGAALYKE